MEMQVALCAVGFVLLYVGANWLVKGSSSLARSLGISPIVIGLTVVAFGTSAPELVVSAVSAVKDKPWIAVGNALGSNVCNIALVLGVTALFQPISARPSVRHREIPLMLVATLLALGLCLDADLTRIDGTILVAGLLLYTLMNYFAARRQARSGDAPAAEGVGHVKSRSMQILLTVVGIAGVVGGAKLVVDAAEVIMTTLGVSQKFIGLTVVAFGTSLPELATSVVAAIRKEMDISIGNLIGSNVFNILGVIGTAAVLHPLTIPGGLVGSGLALDFGVVLLTSVLPWFMLLGDHRVGRRDGILLLLIYGGYFAYLVSTAKVVPPG